ncbi:MAG: hypothetical protein U0165_15440 [Polyangiaceae bacterium]
MIAKNQRLRAQINRAIESFSAVARRWFASPRLIERVADAKTTVLITGGGTGKERVARGASWAIR